jgi:alpha-1,3-rhamnosyltransferase
VSVDVSVVVPSYNHARFVGATLRSIIGQTLAPRELIVIDDGSSDGSPKVIEEILKECPFPCEMMARPNRGLCATLNEGLKVTRGRYFAYLGSDDVWLPEFIKARMDLLEKRPQAVLAYGHAYLINERDRVVDCTRDWAKYTDGDARRMLLDTIAPMSPTVMYRRDRLERKGWNEKAKLEDYDLYLRLSTEGEFAFDPSVLSAWRRHVRNASWNQHMMLEERLEAQRNVAQEMGVGARELARLQRRCRFACAEEFMRVGQKRRGAQLMFQNLGGATSIKALVRMGLRLCLPWPLVERRKERRELRARERYGSIHDLT